ncbi:hypothetical protein MNBD_BACTEROID06-1655 [hydrothermal vent metagenome]|uniref:Uncharacterized protein n=1 Tax=hydrothermal vent metagenome TaxID=652676 RepID=A0A3B0V3H3_9ZZZZ
MLIPNIGTPLFKICATAKALGDTQSQALIGKLSELAPEFMYGL